jgi:hypothetical protein
MFCIYYEIIIKLIYSLTFCNKNQLIDIIIYYIKLKNDRFTCHKIHKIRNYDKTIKLKHILFIHVL